MQQMAIGRIEKFIVHFAGNKNEGDGVRLSSELTGTGLIENHLEQLLSSCLKTEEVYQFYFVPKLDLNPVYQIACELFDNPDSFIEQSRNAAKYLYEKSTHPNIKSGELCVAYLSGCWADGEQTDCIALFKSENKETILKVDSIDKGFNLTDVTGLNVNKLDKACLIFNLERESGFVICIADNTNRNAEAQYWKDDFLSVQTRHNEFHHTNQLLGITKQFVTKQLSEEFEVTKADQIDLLNRTVDYFKNNETFNQQDFEQEVFGTQDVIQSYRKFDQEYREEHELDASDNFQISSQAVKKQSRVFKSVLKLDKNFHIYIHGDKDMIERGIDEDGRKYYKIYYQQEA